MKEACPAALKKGMTIVRPQMARLTSLLLASLSTLPLAVSSVAFADGDLASGTPKPLPADVQTILSHVADLDLLTVLTPVKLTGEQMDKIVATIDPITKTDDEITKQECDSIRAVAPDIDKLRQDSLKGTVPDAETAAKINKTLLDFNSKNAAAHTEALKKVTNVLIDLLTPDQVTTIEKRYAEWSGGKIKVPPQMRDNKAKQEAYIEDAALSAFADRILLVQRTVALLKLMRSVLSSGAPPSASQTGSANAGTGTPPPPPPAAPSTPPPSSK